MAPVVFEVEAVVGVALVPPTSTVAVCWLFSGSRFGSFGVGIPVQVQTPLIFANAKRDFAVS